MVKAMFENVVTTGQPVNRHMILIWTLLSNFIIITLLMFNYQARFTPTYSESDRDTAIFFDKDLSER